MDAVLRRLGGTARVWRTDRLATVIVPGTRDVQASFAPVAKHYGAVVEPCPPRRGNRKGAVESSVRFVSGRWWRTMSATNPEDAQRSLDVFCATTGDERQRRGPSGNGPPSAHWPTPSRSSPCRPAPFPATTEVDRIVADNATVAFSGNRYSVPPGLGATTLLVRHRLGARPSTSSLPRGRSSSPIGSPRPDRERSCAASSTATPSRRAVLSAFSTARPCDKKANRPPGKEALEEAARLLGPDRS